MSTEMLSKPSWRDDVKVRTDETSGGRCPFEKLPDEIIELILNICDSNSFASLILLNTTWRRVSQQPYLYVHHLSGCQSYSASHPAITEPLSDKHLPLLRKSFAQEVKRNLFDAYLRPRETVINLVSTSISSSAAFPGGEAFHFAFSPKGHHVLAYSSSRIYLIKTADKELAVKREFKILRRPASVATLDDASLLAVLSTDHQVDVYDLRTIPPKHIRALALDHAPRTISLAPTGSVLAAAYDAGVEVYSLAATASMTDRRAVKCDAADALSFSQDGTQLLGTTINSRSPSTVILTAPYYDPGDCLPEESISHFWTTSILFPHSSRDCSHAVLLPSPLDDEANWAFTYDRVFETFRAVRIDDLRNGTTYFTGPTADPASGNKLLPSTLPTATDVGELVAAGFQGKEIWLYGVPEDLDPSIDTNQNTSNNAANDVATPTGSLARSNSAPSVRSHTWPRDPASNRIPQWQLLSDKSRNTFVEGRKISTLQGISALKWVGGISHSSCNERLVVVAPGVVGQLSEAEDDGIAPIDGGRFTLLDFDYRPTDGGRCFITIEVGENEPEVLEEEHMDMETEIAVVRRRTVAQRGGRINVLRSATVNTHAFHGSGKGDIRSTLPTVPPMPPMPSIPSVTLGTTEEQPETASIVSLDEAQEALDAPYAHGSPRSAPTLRRAATAAAINRHLHPPRIGSQEPVRMRRPDGRDELPHESDADNWVPPPPPYTRDPVAPLPEHLRNAVTAGPLTTQPAGSLHRSSTQRSSGSTDSNIINSLQRSRTTYLPPSESGRRPSLPLQRTVSDPTSLSMSDESHENQEPTAQASAIEFDDLYDVSPPESPEPQHASPAISATALPGIPAMPSLPYSIPRRPVNSSLPDQPVHPIPVDLPRPLVDSPILDQIATNSTAQAGGRISVPRESIPEPSAYFETSRPSSGTSLTQTRLNAPVPLRPNSDHRLVDMPPSTPTRTPPSSPPSENVQNVNQIRPSSLSIETKPEEGPTESIYEGSPSGYSSPSASQLARLNSRSGRPPNNVLSDPTRRMSGTFPQPQHGSQNHQQYPPRGIATTNVQPWMGSHQYHGAFSPPAPPLNSSRSPTYPPVGYPSSNMQLRQGNLGFSRTPSASTPNLRPRMQRLETIQSVASQAEAATYVRSAGPLRKTSRAERSAALNIQQAKRKGWAGTRRDKKRKDRDGASSAGWTDVSRDSFGDDTGKKKGGRCVVM